MAQMPQNADEVITRIKESPHSSVDGETAGGSGGSPNDGDEGGQFKIPHPPLSSENNGASSTQVGEFSSSNNFIKSSFYFFSEHGKAPGAHFA